MTGQGFEELVVLNRKLDDLLYRYSLIKKEYEELKSENEALKESLQYSEANLNEMKKKYERSKLSGALLGEGENAVEAKRKINELVREIDKCVALLNR